MAKPTFGQVASLVDPLTIESYEMLFASIPGANISLSTLALRCVSATWGGVGVQKMTQMYPGGYEIHYNGRTQFPGQLSLTFVEDRNMAITQAFRQWKEFVKGTNSSNSQGYKVAYATNGQLTIYDTAGAISGTQLFTNLFYQDLQDVQVDPQGQGFLTTLQLSYDRNDMGSVTAT